MSQTHAARRLEALSDIVFGLAMTFLASRLPLPGLTDPAPTWHSLAVRVGPYLSALGLSFSIAGIYWFGHHRRLAEGGPPNSFEVVLNFAFLLVVMLLPSTTEIYERFGTRGSMVSIYCAHLALLSALYLLLWVLTISRSRSRAGAPMSWRQTIGPSFGLAVFLVATMLAFRHPALSQNLLLLAFLGPIVTRMTAAQAPVSRTKLP